MLDANSIAENLRPDRLVGVAAAGLEVESLAHGLVGSAGLEFAHGVGKIRRAELEDRKIISGDVGSELHLGSLVTPCRDEIG